MANPPIVDNTDIVNLSIKINGTLISSTIKVLSVETEQSVNQIGQSTIVLKDLQATKEFKPDDEVSICVGYEQQPVTEIFLGKVLNFEVKIDNHSLLTIIHCIDQAIAMTVKSYQTDYLNMSCSDVVTNIVDDYSSVISGQIESSLIDYPKLIQPDATDWDFIIALALAEGRVVINQNAVIDVLPPSLTSSVLTLTLGENIISFNASSADALGDQSATPSGQVEFQGNSDVTLGSTVTLKKLGKSFSGEVFVSGVSHTIEAGEWTTTLDFGLDLNWLKQQSIVNAILPKPVKSEIKFKTMVSQNGHKLEVDEQNNVITLISALGNQVVISDEHDNQSIMLKDINGNQITLDSEGISLVSAKNLVLSANGDVSINASGNVSLAGALDSSISGTNVNLQAQALISVTGDAGAELISSAQTTVRGALVSIN